VLERFAEYFTNRSNVQDVSAEDLNRFIVDLMKNQHMAANTVIHNAIIIAQFLKRQGRPNMTRELHLPGRITTGSAHMFRPSFPSGPPDMFICGNHDEAKKTVARILSEFGWGCVDTGGIESSRYLEAMCLVRVLYGARTNTWNHAFKLLRR
jgi:hypothetical protein